MMEKWISMLVQYGINNNLIKEEDRIYSTNLILDIMGLDEFSSDFDKNLDEVKCLKDIDLEEVLEELLSFAVKRGIIEDSVIQKDLFDTRLMNVLMPRPSEVIDEFDRLYEEDSKKATDYYYKLSKASNYIRTKRVKKDIRWKYSSKYGELDITINKSKPEKDPKDIAAAGRAVASDYPKCLLCKENEGYAGRINHPGRLNHRIIPVMLKGEKWGFQYSPYVYYNEHCIVLSSEHRPMKINKDTFERMFEFVKKFPHYMLGSNADLPIVGGSILSHDHFQGGAYEFPMARAEDIKTFAVKGFEEVELSILKWPVSVIRLKSVNEERIIELGERILNKWIDYRDEELEIIPYTDGVRHNTVTPIARFRNGKYELDLALRNNRTTKERPFGIFHPREEYHHIKKENIGLIEVMGLAVLPPRLDDGTLDDEKKEYIGGIFEKVLEDAGVFKQNDEGLRGFERFVNMI